MINKLKINRLLFALLFMFTFVAFIHSETLTIIYEDEEVPEYVRGIHVTMWIAGTKKFNDKIVKLLEDTELNTMIIDIKEYDGKVCIPELKDVKDNKLYINAIKNMKEYVQDLKDKGIYVVARQVVFRDNGMPRANTDLAVKNPDGTLWTDRSNATWLDPYNKKAWDYNIKIAEKAADLGFQEIQFDYIRFPSDGATKKCTYSKPHSKKASSEAIVGFLKEANKRLKKKGVKISIDVFGLTTTATDDMGIGQKIVEMTKYVDYVSPMIYPSHYAKGEYAIANPNNQPYTTVYKALEGALGRIPKEKLRPYYQDFSLGIKYDVKKVRAQIQAGYDVGVGSWLLWNARCVYTTEALLESQESDTFKKSDPPTDEMLKTKARIEAAKKKKEEAERIKKEQEQAKALEKENSQTTNIK